MHTASLQGLLPQPLHIREHVRVFTMRLPAEKIKPMGRAFCTSLVENVGGIYPAFLQTDERLNSCAKLASFIIME
ncbi:MAG: hypothetical protein Q4G39_06885 [Brachymonas sp.]|nr:hypothetical protein [Brachymonas sp.]